MLLIYVNNHRKVWGWKTHLENILSNILFRAGAAMAGISSLCEIFTLPIKCLCTWIISPWVFALPSWNLPTLSASPHTSDGLVLYSSLCLFIGFTSLCPCLSHTEWWGIFSFGIKQIVEEEKYDRRKSTTARSDRFHRAKSSIGL